MIRTPRHRDERGFSLISVLVAITILAVGLMALARTQALLARTEGATAYRATALAIAKGYVEELRSRDAGTLGSEAAVPVDRLGEPAAGGPFSRATVVSNDAPNLRRVTVRVDYPRSAQPIELVTLIFGAAP
jgi:type IV pilus assembly protein PilV